MRALKGLIYTLLIALGMVACKEHIDMSARYVLKEETAYSYLSKHEQYSDFVSLIDNCTHKQIVILYRRFSALCTWQLYGICS